MRQDIKFALRYSDRNISMRKGAIMRQRSALNVVTMDSLRGIYDLKIRVIAVDGYRLAQFYNDTAHAGLA